MLQYKQQSIETYSGVGVPNKVASERSSYIYTTISDLSVLPKQQDAHISLPPCSLHLRPFRTCNRACRLSPLFVPRPVFCTSPVFIKGPPYPFGRRSAAFLRTSEVVQMEISPQSAQEQQKTLKPAVIQKH